MWLILLVPTTNGPNSSTNTRNVKSGATRSQARENTACCPPIAVPLLPAFCNFIFQTTCRPLRIQIAGFGGRAIVVAGDVSKSADVARLFVETKAAYGALDVLVNNAAVYQLGPLEAITEEEFHREFNTNVLGPLLMIREAVKYFGPRGGSIINIGSMASQVTPPNLSIYTATKSALDAITRVLAKELGPRQIRVNSINPGATATEGARAAGVIGVGSDYEKQLLAMTPLGRIGQPSDIAPIAVFLASDESGWLTGEIILASGGQR